MESVKLDTVANLGIQEFANFGKVIAEDVNIYIKKSKMKLPMLK